MSWRHSSHFSTNWGKAFRAGGSGGMPECVSEGGSKAHRGAGSGGVNVRIATLNEDCLPSSRPKNEGTNLWRSPLTASSHAPEARHPTNILYPRLSVSTGTSDTPMHVANAPDVEKALLIAAGDGGEDAPARKLREPLAVPAPTPTSASARRTVPSPHPGPGTPSCARNGSV
jgi:hypothetical protein